MRFAVQHAIGDSHWTAEVLAPRALFEWCRAVESSGWDAIGFTDHPAPTMSWIDSGGEGVADPFTSLGFCAAATERVRLLTFVLVPSYRSPFVAAHQLATLDRLSDGRVTVGLGTGYLFGELRALGTPPDARLEVFDSNVEIMRRAWRGEEVSFTSGTAIAKRVRVLPPVVQSPHPPLWIHGNSNFGLTRAASYGDGWLAMMTSDQLARTTRTRAIPDLPALADRIEALRHAAAGAGRAAGSPEVVVAGAWPMLDYRDRLPTGQYLQQVRALEEIGVDWTVSLCCGDDAGAAVETVSWFGEEVIGAFRPR